MKGKIVWLFVLLVAALLSACNSQSANHSETENAEAPQCEADTVVPIFQSALLNERQFYEYQSKYIFTTTMRIHEDMPVFTFHRIVGDYAPEPWHEIPRPREVSIIVKDENGAIVQVISDLTQSSRYGTQGIAFDDFNFDGYLDMRLLRFQDGAGGRLVTEYIWLWDRSASQFALNRQLMDIENAGLSANQYTRRIEAFHRAGADHFFTFFEYHDGEFARIPDIDDCNGN